MQFKHVTLDFDGPVAILKLDHQEVMNAVSMDMLGGLGEALDAIDDKRDEVRCLVLTGAGRAFCTGANLQGRNNQKPGRSNAGAALETGFHPFLRRLAQSALPDRDRRQWTCRRRRHEFCADGRHDPVRALVLFPAGVPPHRPGAGLRIDLAVAAADRQGALGRTVADGRTAAGREGAGMGPRQPRP